MSNGGPTACLPAGMPRVVDVRRAVYLLVQVKDQSSSGTTQSLSIQFSTCGRIFGANSLLRLNVGAERPKLQHERETYLIRCGAKAGVYYWGGARHTNKQHDTTGPSSRPGPEGSEACVIIQLCVRWLAHSFPQFQSC